MIRSGIAFAALLLVFAGARAAPPAIGRAVGTSLPAESAGRDISTKCPQGADTSSASIQSPYGVCAHLHRMKDEAFRAEECFWMASAGIGRVRFDLEWWRVQPEPGAAFDFSHYDAVIADAEASVYVLDTVGNAFAVGQKEGDKRWSKRLIWNGAGKR